MTSEEILKDQVETKLKELHQDVCRKCPHRNDENDSNCKSSCPFGDALEEYLNKKDSRKVLK